MLRAYVDLVAAKFDASIHYVTKIVAYSSFKLKSDCRYLNGSTGSCEKSGIPSPDERYLALFAVTKSRRDALPWKPLNER